VKVLRILTTSGQVFSMALQRVAGHMPFRPDFPDAVSVDLVDMTPEEFLALPLTPDAARRFAL
jgi:hypothetical protein